MKLIINNCGNLVHISGRLFRSFTFHCIINGNNSNNVVYLRNSPRFCMMNGRASRRDSINYNEKKPWTCSENWFMNIQLAYHWTWRAFIFYFVVSHHHLPFSVFHGQRIAHTHTSIRQITFVRSISSDTTSIASLICVDQVLTAKPESGKINEKRSTARFTQYRQFGLITDKKDVFLFSIFFSAVACCYVMFHAPFENCVRCASPHIHKFHRVNRRDEPGSVVCVWLCGRTYTSRTICTYGRNERNETNDDGNINWKMISHCWYNNIIFALNIKYWFISHYNVDRRGLHTLSVCISLSLSLIELCVYRRH